MQINPPIPPETPPFDQSILLDWLGAIDIYLLDQVMKGNLQPGMCLLDAGCGHGRNSGYFLRTGYEVHGVDANPEMIAYVREQVAHTEVQRNRYQVALLEKLPFEAAAFDAVICVAVLHFARDDAHFEAMVHELWRVLRPGGLFFARLCSDIGIEDRVQPLGGRRYLLPDGSQRYVVDEAMLRDKTRQLGGAMTGPLKTVNVQHQRCMTNWVMTKGI